MQTARLAGLLWILFVPLLPAAQWKSVRLEPERIALANPGSRQRYLVIATDARGMDADVTAEARVRAAGPGVTIDETGHAIVGSAVGRARVQVRFAGLASSATVEVGSKPASLSVSFTGDVISILTTKGCNGSGCHGSPAGQAGFKLSLFGYDAAADHEMITRGGNGRRVNREKPAESLFLRKPLFAVPHGGGRLLNADSEEYRTLLHWLEQGAQADASGPRLEKLELYPKRPMLVLGQAGARLVAMGRLTDGTTRDMTREVRFATGDESVVKVSGEGIVTAAARGLTSVMARGMGQVATSLVGVTPTADWPAAPEPEGSFIDRLVAKQLWRMQVKPYPLSSDSEFLRRVYLDVAGVLPPPDRTAQFLSDPSPRKREQLIDELLASREYASNWTVKFEDWFRNCQLHMQGRSMGVFKDWIREWVHEDRPYDSVVRELLTSNGDNMLKPAVNFWHPAADFMLKKFDVNKVTPTVTRLFLGVRLECAECHNHPLENFTQNDFYGVSAFFARLRVKHGYGEYRRTWYLEDSGEVEHPVTKKAVAPRFLNGAAPEIAPEKDRREALADWIVDPKNPYFARATVNRVWNEYFDAGIVEPFDDFRSTNMPTNPELLDRLAEEFVKSGYHLKSLHRMILNSRVYQSSSSYPGRAAESPALERLLFARYMPRRLGAEVLIDAVSALTQSPHEFKYHPAGISAKELYIPDNPDYFLVTFGFPRRDILASRPKSPTLAQALHLMNSDAVRQKVQSPTNLLAGLMERGDDAQAVAALFRRAYARDPSPAEAAIARDYLAAEAAAGRTRRKALEGVLWSVLNSKEFQLNH